MLLPALILWLERRRLAVLARRPDLALPADAPWSSEDNETSDSPTASQRRARSGFWRSAGGEK